VAACLPDTPEDQIPVTSITNGVHAPTWIAPELVKLFDQISALRGWTGTMTHRFWIMSQKFR